MTSPSPTPSSTPLPSRPGPLRILVVARGYPSFDAVGRGSFVADQVAALVGAGHHVTVAGLETVPAPDAAAGPAGGRAEAAWTDAVRSRVVAPVGRRWGPAVPVAWLPAFAVAGPSGDPDHAATVEREASVLEAATGRLPGAPFDAIHAHTGLTAGIAAASVGRRLGIPVLVTEHDSTLRTRLLHRSARTLYRRLLAPGCRLVAVSAALAGELEALLEVAPGRIPVIPNVVDMAAFPAVTGPRRAGELLWVGGRHAGKGTDVLLGALADLRRDRPDARLRLIGSAPSAAEEARLRELAATLGLAGAVSFEPPADRRGVATAMAEADVFVHPSAYETFGVVAAEAAASGLPVAATPSGGVPAILGPDGSLGEVAADHTPEALARAVRAVLGRRELFDPVAMHAAIESRHSPSAVAHAIGRALRELGAGATDAGSRPGAGCRTSDTPDAAPAAGPLDPPVVVVAMRRGAAGKRLGALPPELAAGLVAVTTAGTTDDAPLPPGPRWMEIDPERGFREARARLGGALPAGSLPVRVGRIARHPVRTMRRRSLYARRAEIRDHTLALGVRDAVVAAAAGGPVTVLPADIADVAPVLPLLGDGAWARLAPTTLRGLAQAWDAAGAPALASPAPGASAAYDPAAYWTRLHARRDLSAVGQSGLPPEINAWLYRSLARTLRGFLHRHGLDRPPPARAFDVGVGTGYWVRFWRALGVETVDGCDLVPAAVEAVRDEAAAAHLAGTYRTADIGVEGSLPAETYGAVSCVNVLLHLTDDAAFDRALAGIAGLVAPGGALVLAEPMLLDPSWERPHEPDRHSRARPVARYREPLEAAGLVLEDLRPGTALANNPIEAGSRGAYRRYARWWRWVAAESKADPCSARWLGPLVLACDRVALRAGAAPSTKLALFRRPGRESR